MGRILQSTDIAGALASRMPRRRIGSRHSQRGFILNPFAFGSSSGGGETDPLRANQVLHLPGNGANNGTTFTDASPKARSPSSVVSTVVTDTANPRFGTSSINFTNGRILYADSADWAMGSGDFIVRFWFKLNSNGPSSRVFFCGQASSAGGNGAFSVYKNTSDQIIGQFIPNDASGTITATSTLAVGNTNWHWCEFTRVGNTIYISLDGANFGTGNVTGKTMTDSPEVFAVGAIGAYAGGGYGGANGDRMTGWIADFQVYKGVGGNTSAFTPPTTQQPTS